MRRYLEQQNIRVLPESGYYPPQKIEERLPGLHCSIATQMPPHFCLPAYVVVPRGWRKFCDRADLMMTTAYCW